MKSKTAALSRIAPSLVLSSRYWYRRFSRREDPELRVLESLIRPGSVAIDVGGNIGDYTFSFSRHARQVFTFEPLPECARLIELAGLKNVTIHQIALSSATGSFPLHIPTSDDGRHDLGKASLLPPEGPHRVMTVSVRRLDDIDVTDVSVMKIDVEGHELAVIDGAEETIRRERPVILVEIEERHLDVPVEHVFGKIQRLGYTGFFLDGSKGFRPIAEFSETIHQRPYVDQDSHPAYVNNFFFVPLDDARLSRFRE